MITYFEKLTDGRERLVIDREDGSNPMYVYGKDRDEMLEKMARTVATGQATIERLRTATPTAAPNHATPPATSPAQPAPRRAAPTPDEVMVAAADLSNPAKSPAAVKTLLKAAGVDVDTMTQEQEARRIAGVARTWNAAHPEFPTDRRNSRLLIDRATLNVGFGNITAQALDTAYAQLLSEGWTFEPDEQQQQQQQQQHPTEGTQPGGSPEPRVTRPRMATSYSRNSLTARAPAAQPKAPYTRAELDAMNRTTFKEKVLDVPAVREWYEREFSGATAVA